MMMGLLRWPTLQWTLGQAWVSASLIERGTIAERFAFANFVLGNVIGELIGELFLNGFFLAAALAVASGRQGYRWLPIAGAAAVALGWSAMWRNVTPVVAPIAALNNVALPLWMLVLGIALVRAARRPA